MLEEFIQKHMWKMVFAAAFLGLLVDAMDLQFLSLSLPLLMKEFGITKVQAGALGTYTLIGMALGGALGGWISDRVGRVKTVAWTIVLFSVATFALSFSQSFAQFAMIRFVSATGLGAEYVVCNTLMAEYVPTKKRTTVLGSMQAGWSVGYLMATLLAAPILPVYGWRPLFLIALAPVALAIVIRHIIPEPAGWRELAAEASGRKRIEWQMIFTDKKVLWIFVLWTLTATFLQFGYYGINNWLPSYLVDELHFDFKKMTGYLIGTYAAMILGKVVTGWLADRFGRRTMFVAGGVLTALALPVIVNYHTPGNIVLLMTGFGFLYGMPFAVNATYMAESFATSIRGTAVGAAYNIGRAGAAAAPVLIGVAAAHKSIGFGLALMGFSYALCGLIPAIFIREKMHEPYKEPETGVGISVA
jgi:AAHS family cis,cis-muconate transporter-like MFS transporter